MPPQPNCLPTGVPSYEGKWGSFWRVVLHCCLSTSLTISASNSSHLRYTTETTSQRQATVKFHGVFASHWKSLAFAPGKSVRETLVRDSGDLVIPFMQAVIQTARHFAHDCYFPQEWGNDHQLNGGRIFLYAQKTQFSGILKNYNYFRTSPYIAARIGLYLPNYVKFGLAFSLWGFLSKRRSFLLIVSTYEFLGFVIMSPK